ncbi:4-hydroxybenzoate synthetase [Pasteurellaceae bacterium LFhippo2]|nr:4-hydroxybenzoate synthetase [Pasteurellaceae bacterium LFhippo2]
MNIFSNYRNMLSQQNWQSDESLLPVAVADWLMHTDSLTLKLQQICSNLNVEIIQQSWQLVGFEQNFAKTWLREVLLKSGKTQWIFAQTLFPEKTIENVAQEVVNLGNDPIGLWLFPQNPERVSLEWQQDSETGLYMRRSQLMLKNYPLEIRELFLEQFPFE